MILKNQTKSLFYLDRDTDISPLVDDILRTKRAEITVFIQRQQERLQEKDAGKYYTLEDSLKLKDGELENMQRFFRGAVVPYYARQRFDIWSESIEPSILFEATIEIKKLTGFMKYDHTGHLTDEVNSMSSFERVKDLVEWLNTVEAVCFQDNAYIFPDSDHFKKLESEKGRHSAQRQVFLELYQKVKNQYYKGEII